MTAAFEGPTVTLNGTTWTTIASCGASEQKEIFSIIILNKDTVDHTYKGRKTKAAVNDEHFTVKVLAGKTGILLPPGASIVLDASDEIYEVNYEAALTTNESKAEVAIFKVP